MVKKLLIALLAVGLIAPFANAYNEVDPWWVAIGPIQFGSNPPDYTYYGPAYPVYYSPYYYRGYYYPQNTYSYSYAYAGARSSYSYASSGSYYAPSYSSNYYPRQSYYGGPSDYCVQMAARGYYVC